MEHRTQLTFGVAFALVAMAGGDAAAQAAKNKPYFYDNVKVLCVGVNQYPHTGIGNLRKAEADAKLFGQTLRSVFGYEDVYLLGPNATKAKIESTVKRFGNQLGEDDALIVYFACHGVVIERSQVVENVSVPTLEGYLLPYNAAVDVNDPNNENWDKTSLNMFQFVEMLDSLSTEHVLVVADCCCSGFLTTRGIQDAAWQVNLLKRPSRQIIAATTKEESAQEGVFTPSLVKVLKGFQRKIEAASVTDVFDEVVKPVAAVSQRRMTPRMSHFGQGDGEFVFFPRSLPSDDVRLVRREVDKERAAVERRPAANAVGRGILRGIVRRANQRGGLRTELSTVAAAMIAANYWYGTKAAEKTEYWRKIRERLEKNAARNDPLAMAGLVFCYERGLGESEHKPNPERAYRWAVSASQVRGASGIGKYLLARCYSKGIGVDQNKASALKLYRESARDGFILGELAVAELTLRDSPSEREAREAVQVVKRAANQQIPRAHFVLGDVYASGSLGLPRDLTTAVKAYEEAVKLGAPQPMVLLYDAYSAGVPGVISADVRKAEAILRDGAEEGVASAQNYLAEEYLQGRDMRKFLNLPRNPSEGIKWLELAGKQDYGPALVSLARIYGLGEVDGIKVDFDKARRNVEKAVAQNNAEAFVLQGGMYLGGVYEKDEQKAFRCFEQAARLGAPLGCEQLGRCYEFGIGVPPGSAHVAYHWYVKAVENGGSEFAEERLRVLAFRLQGDGMRILRNWEKTNPQTAALFRQEYVR